MTCDCVRHRLTWSHIWGKTIKMGNSPFQLGSKGEKRRKGQRKGKEGKGGGEEEEKEGTGGQKEEEHGSKR